MTSPDLTALAIEVRARLSLAELLGGIGLRRAGGGWRSACPLCSAGASSGSRPFSVRDREQTWRCFACGERGDAIDWIARETGKGKGEVIAEQARRLGLLEDGGRAAPLPPRRRPVSRPEPETVDRSETFAPGLGRADPAALDYIAARLPGIDLEVIAPELIDGSRVPELRKLTAAGWRAWLPVRSAAEPSRIVSAQGRYLGSGWPEWGSKVMGPRGPWPREALVFRDLGAALAEAKKTGALIVAEGVMDTVAAVGAGFRAVVGVPGVDHAEALARHLRDTGWTGRLVLSLDNDPAGDRFLAPIAKELRGSGIVVCNGRPPVRGDDLAALWHRDGAAAVVAAVESARRVRLARPRLADRLRAARGNATIRARIVKTLRRMMQGRDRIGRRHAMRAAGLALLAAETPPEELRRIAAAVADSEADGIISGADLAVKTHDAERAATIDALREQIADATERNGGPLSLELRADLERDAWRRHHHKHRSLIGQALRHALAERHALALCRAVAEGCDGLGFAEVAEHWRLIEPETTARSHDWISSTADRQADVSRLAIRDAYRAMPELIEEHRTGKRRDFPTLEDGRARLKAQMEATRETIRTMANCLSFARRYVNMETGDSEDVRERCNRAACPWCHGGTSGRFASLMRLSPEERAELVEDPDAAGGVGTPLADESYLTTFCRAERDTPESVREAWAEARKRMEAHARTHDVRAEDWSARYVMVPAGSNHPAGVLVVAVDDEAGVGAGMLEQVSGVVRCVSRAEAADRLAEAEMLRPLRIACAVQRQDPEVFADPWARKGLRLSHGLGDGGKRLGWIGWARQREALNAWSGFEPPEHGPEVRLCWVHVATGEVFTPLEDAATARPRKLADLSAAWSRHRMLRGSPLPDAWPPPRRRRRALATAPPS